MTHPRSATPRHPVTRAVWTAAVLALVVSSIAQAIGPAKIHLGPAELAIFPMVWALIAAGLISAQKIRPIGPAVQHAADGIMAVGVIFLCARLAFTVGPNVRVLFDAGPALLLQEFGHLLGTVVLALPIAVLLRMGRATVGATFSVDREPSLGIVSERYGAESDEYRGVLSMYVFGTLFGAIVVTFLASLLTSFRFFDPLALAMGSGVGSGSMMAAAAGVIADAHPEQSSQILAMASTSNLITGMLGTYVGVWIALPLADFLYRKMTRTPKPARAVDAATTTELDATTPAADEVVADTHPSVPLGIGTAIFVVVSTVVAAIAAKGFSWHLIAGMAIVTAVAFGGFAGNRLVRKVPTVIWATAIGTALSLPWSPVADVLGKQVASIDFLSMCAVVLTFAGLGLGKSLPQLRMVGWRIVPVGLVALVGSFVLSTVIAEFTLGMWS
ncbi:DUF3100 domain-containing protein [Gordonia sp. NPDC003424]